MNCVDYFFENTSEFHKDLIIGTQETISYKSIFASSYLLASFLQQKIGTGNNILLITQNNSFFIIAYLGILKSGNICIPLNPTVEQNNLNFIIKKTKCKIGFISNVVAKRLDISIDIISESDYLLNLNGDILEKRLNGDFDGNQIAEVIFTSGSTALPKGVMLTHNNIISNTNSIIQYLNLTENDIMQVVLPFFYCYGLSLLHTHIRAGGQLVINNNFMFLASTINNINKFKCTGFAGVPSHFQILLRKTELFKNTKFPSLRYVTQAGGKLHNAFITEFIETFPSIDFFVMYGQTEATARLSYLKPEKLKEKLGSLGKGIPGVELKVINSKGRIVDPGETGEIIARGENIMLGYYDDPIETSYALQDGWLYTGDLGTIDKEGYIFLTARRKEIIKVGGKRVSPKEIEEVINMIPGVVDCSIESISDELLGEGIMSIIVITEYIKQFCSMRLSAYKIPTSIIFKDSMELNSAGKKIKIL